MGELPHLFGEEQEGDDEEAAEPKEEKQSVRSLPLPPVLLPLPLPLHLPLPRPFGRFHAFASFPSWVTLAPLSVFLRLPARFPRGVQHSLTFPHRNANAQAGTTQLSLTSASGSGKASMKLAESPSILRVMHQANQELAQLDAEKQVCCDASLVSGSATDWCVARQGVCAWLVRGGLTASARRVLCALSLSFSRHVFILTPPSSILRPRG